MQSVTGSIEVLQQNAAIQVNIFPNPASAQLNLDFNLTQKANVELFILDQQGKLVHEVYYEKVKNAKKFIDIKKIGLSAGIYTFQFVLDDQQTLTKTIQIQ
jgi:hypothetical protein